ncbi:hypothetical protein OAD74_07290 [Alphaproteobacteria bacterium]|nr:hypothetical protein [Alphaproteobacteria bacterium]
MKYLQTPEACLYHKLGRLVAGIEKNTLNGEISLEFELAETLLADYAYQYEDKIWENILS